MWIPLLHDKTNYLLKCEGNEVSLTDLKHLWEKKIDKDDLVSKFKDLNPLYSSEDDNVFTEARKMMEDVSKITSAVETDDGSECTVHWKSKISELPIYLELILIKSDIQMYYDKVIVPMMKTIQFLELKKNKLIELMDRKDKEIMEYNLEYGIISRKNIITEKYDEAEVEGNNLFLNVFTKSHNFYSNLVEKHGNILDEYPELKEAKEEKRKLTLPNSWRMKKKRNN